ncbi:MAG: hypothetical protein ACP5QR_05175 [Rhizomicrobium sp.]
MAPARDEETKMLAPKNFKAQAAQMSPDLAAEKAAARKLFHFGQPQQSPEYIAAAKALNKKLREAGLTTQMMVEG